MIIGYKGLFRAKKRSFDCSQKTLTHDFNYSPRDLKHFGCGPNMHGYKVMVKRAEISFPGGWK